MNTLTILKAGYGYWDTTNYPIFGCFRRAKEDFPVTLIPGDTVKDKSRGFYVGFKFGNQQFGYTQPHALETEKAEGLL
jgi:hypothetical protein